MSVVDLHPEELLDKDARGLLSDGDRVRLATHLARCAACRAERLMRADFAEELLADERDSGLHGLVQGALLAAPGAALHAPSRDDAAPRGDGAAAPESASKPGRPLAARRRTRRVAMWAFAAAALIGASAAAAGVAVRGASWLHVGGSQEASRAQPATLATSSSPVKRTLPGAAATAAAEPSASEGLDAPPASEAVAALSVAWPAGASAAGPPRLVPAPDASAVRIVPAARGFVAAPRPAATIETLGTPAELFDSANIARRNGDAAGALARYGALQLRHADSREARLSKATVGRMLLDGGDARGALASFDAYLAAGSRELREDVMAARATALERLGRADDETRAWAALLADYPRTAYAAHAKIRLGRTPDR